jgi:hypothetical protein
MRKNIIIKLTFLFCIIIILLSCKYRYYCDGYDISNKTIISFREGDTIIYVSNHNDTMQLYINNSFFEGPSSFEGFAMDYECFPLAYYITSKDSMTNIYIKEQDGSRMFVLFMDALPYNFPTGIYRNFEQAGDTNGTFEIEKEIRGVKYKYVWDVKDLSKNRRIDRFIKVSMHGILEFHDKNTDLTWTQLIK